MKDRMLQRYVEWDYRSRCIYMITVTAFEHRPIFGRLVGDEAKPEICKSALGEIVAHCWAEIPKRYPSVELLEAVVMPDHFHGVLFVRERLEKPLGAIVGFLKAHSTSLFRRGASVSELNSETEERGAGVLELNGEKEKRGAGATELNGEKEARGAGVTELNGETEERGASALELNGEKEERGAGASGLGRGAEVQFPAACGGRIWAPGFHDRILFRRGQLAQMLAYVRDNPRRLAVKRAHPELFRVVRELSLVGHSFSAIGNHFLLERPVRMAIQCSRRISPEALDKRQRELLAAARKGVVLISPCISPGEKQIARAALDAQLPVIVLLENGFPPIYKPPKRYFEACAEGRLLMLAPWEHHVEKRPITREQCLALNAFAKQFATDRE